MGLSRQTEEASEWTTIPRDSQGSNWIKSTVGIRGVAQFWNVSLSFESFLIDADFPRSKAAAVVIHSRVAHPLIATIIMIFSPPVDDPSGLAGSLGKLCHLWSDSLGISSVRSGRELISSNQRGSDILGFVQA